MRVIKRHIVLVFTMFLIASCSTTRVLKENEYVYHKTKIEIQTDGKVDKRPSKRKLKEITSPVPNKRVFGLLPFKLWAYNLAGDSIPDKGFRHWLKYKIGEPPVLFKPYYITTTEEKIANVLENSGYFDKQVRSEKLVHHKKVSVKYTIKVAPPYRIDTLVYPAVRDSLTSYMNTYYKSSILQQGAIFDLKNLKNERRRIDDELKKEGYYRFSANYLYYKLDTLSKQKRVGVELAIKNEIPANAREMYYINQVRVDHSTNYTHRKELDTIIENGIIHLYDSVSYVKPGVVERSIFFKNNQKFNSENYRATLEKLTSLGVFKFVNISFEDSISAQNRLNAHIQLSPTIPKSIGVEMQAVSKSNDFVGPGVKVSYQNRNINRTATSLVTNLNAGYETQLNKIGNAVNSYELGARVEITIPRFISPYFNANALVSRHFRPETRVKAGYSFFKRTNYYSANSLSASFGYKWRETQTKLHELDLISVNFLSLNNVNPDLQDNYMFNRNYREQFITATRYEYTINNILFKENRLNAYFNTSFEIAGLIPGMVKKISPSTPDDTKKLFGIAFSQYMRFTVDFRQYIRMFADNQLVSRLYIGFGRPFGNSDILPYRKQFYAGGSSSLRAFSSRSLGPGGYRPSDSLSSFSNFEQAGDIKLEANLEYRFGIYKIVKGAFFMDAGNVWLLFKDEQIAKGVFNKNEFMQQIAIGSGFGVRVDAKLFVIRFDIGIPLRKPFLEEGQQWIYQDIDFNNPVWRKDNIVYNIAIGYPF